MSTIYGVCADIHFHDFSAFSGTEHQRLFATIREFERFCEEVRAAGGRTVIVAGDVFHTRGSVKTEVMNAVLRSFMGQRSLAMNIYVLDGNHDISSKDPTPLTSSIDALRYAGVNCVHEVSYIPTEKIVLVPWHDDISALKTRLEEIVEMLTKHKSNIGEWTLITHAPIDGTIDGLPSHGLDASYLASLGFQNVLAGHYHNAKDFGNGVYSIGALCHQTWSDLGSKAGFRIVEDGKVTFRASHSPSFIEISPETDPSEIPLVADGNYVRAITQSSNAADIEELRRYLLDCGALGVTIISKPPVKNLRDGEVKASCDSIAGSVLSYLKAGSYSEAVTLACADILKEVEAR